ncbi:hypothetical protein MUP77_07210 [Candidatus Bathyarchaeota archaeon]|nr:hypothetical protein [Candidatus Bathyarchaeota archaeon]
MHVRDILGHTTVQSMEVYTHMIDFGDEEFVSQVAKTSDEACKLVEAGFEYVCTASDSLMIFRKRK